MCFPLQENVPHAPARRPGPFAVAPPLRAVPMLTPPPTQPPTHGSEPTVSVASDSGPVSGSGPTSQTGRGRPKNNPAESRTAQLHVLVTPAERSAVHRAAADAGLSVSAFVRRRALGQPVTARADAQARAALRRVGVNLNQLARAANAAGPTGAPLGVGSALAAKAEAVLADVLAAVERLGGGPGSPTDSGTTT